MKENDDFSETIGFRKCGVISEGEQSLFERSEDLWVRISTQKEGLRGSDGLP